MELRATPDRPKMEGLTQSERCPLSSAGLLRPPSVPPVNSPPHADVQRVIKTSRRRCLKDAALLQRRSRQNCDRIGQCGVGGGEGAAACNNRINNAAPLIM